MSQLHNPSWLLRPALDVQLLLHGVPSTILWDAYVSVHGILSLGRRQSREYYVQDLSSIWIERATRCAVMPTDLLHVFCLDVVRDPSLLDSYSTPIRRHILLSIVFRKFFGDHVFHALCTPAFPDLGSQACRPEFIFIEDQMPSVPALKDKFLQLSESFVVGVVQRAHPVFGWKDKRFRAHAQSAAAAADYFRHCVSYFGRCRDHQLLDVLISVSPFADVDPLLCEDFPSLFFVVMKFIFGTIFVDGVFRDRRDHSTSIANESSYEWPAKVEDLVVRQRLSAYFKGSHYTPPAACAVCGQSKDGNTVTYVDSASDDYANMNFHLLDFPTSIVPKHVARHFAHPLPFLNGKVLDFSLVRADMSNGRCSIPVCSSCASAMRRPRPGVPKFALANGLYRGRLPEEFRDLTWIEEAVCAIYRSTAIVTRLYGSKDTDSRNPFKLRGNTCAHQMNVSSTARALPRTPVDVLGMISVVFIGTASLDKVYLREIFRVRKLKLVRFLHFLKRNNPLYYDVEIDSSVFSQYPDDSELPGVGNSVIHVHMPADEIFDDETSGATEHPATTLSSGIESCYADGGEFFFERTGVSDPEGSTLLGRQLQASAIRNVTFSQSPDLAISHSQGRVPEYDNPSLMPGMFPTLFPFGCGGFENKEQKPKLSFRVQAEYYLDTSDRVFRKHNSFIFVILNMWQRREAHLHTYLTVSKPNFDTVARRLLTVSPPVLSSLAKKIETEGHVNDLSEEEKQAFQLLNYVNSVSMNVPGSQASKLKMRNEIVSYAGFFGIPSLFLTVNPCAQHSPIFQLMVGDLSVDLDSRFPTLVPSQERAIRLASDPVAAADFFQFCMTCIFRDLFGWDFGTRSSSTTGILGVLSAFYGSCEFNNRGQLHGHFLLYLEGAPNPSEIHRRLKSSPSYQLQFFEFFDDIIRHDLPDLHCLELADSKYECRVERPVPPPPLSVAELRSLAEGHEDSSSSTRDYDAWRVAFEYDVKKCGEKLQRHVHRSVCSKYKKDGKCRFLFPHEVVEKSFFDKENDAIVLAVRDATVNYHNQYLLVFCRHNHDIRFILSGKGAKAAMFYITDYITKMDVKTYQVLSMLSKAVCDFTRLASGQDEFAEDTLSAKKLLHKCLSQFSRQQEIHAQQAVRYIRGLTDSFSSHETVTMSSRSLVSFVRNYYGFLVIRGDADAQDQPASETVRVAIDEEGRLICMGRVSDYFYREDRLKDVSFYDFVRCFRRRKSRSLTDLEGCKTFNFKAGHQLATTHVLLQFGELVYDKRRLGQIPRVYGMSIPKAKAGDKYMFFVLCHFKPFGVDDPLFRSEDSIEDVFGAYAFPSRSRRIMDNWEALNECEDAREADRQKQRDAYAKEGNLQADLSKTTRSVADSIDEMNNTDVESNSSGRFKEELEAQRVAMSLLNAGWFSRSSARPVENASEETSVDNGADSTPHHTLSARPSAFSGFPELVTFDMMKDWRRQIKYAEEEVSRCRRQALVHVEDTSDAIVTSFNVRETVVAPSSDSLSNQLAESLSVRDTVTFAQTSACYSREEFTRKIDEIREEASLNEMQTVAYNVIVKSYVDLQDKRTLGREDEHEPLRMFLTGPGGTGKTHVVNCVKKMMGLYNASHRIRFLAPTGSAAALIDGMTIHRGLGIKVSSSTVNGGTDIHVSVRNRAKLRDEWRNVDVVMIDEVSMISLNLLCQLDHALRYVKEKPDVFFGGIELITAGDLYQLPPVQGAPLYDAIRVNGKANDGEIEKRLGALAWHSISKVVELTEQVRMAADPEYAAAVLRLRKRACIAADVDLFNSRVIKSEVSHLLAGQGSVDLSTEQALEASVLVATNIQRTALNMLKARSNCSGEESPELHICEALDVYADDRKLVDNSPPYFDRDHLLQLAVSGSNKASAGKIASLKLPGFIPLYIGMPIVIRDKNISTDLRVTNGARGTVVHITFKPPTVVGSINRKVADVVFVHIPVCPLHLPGLPPSVVPLSAISSSFQASPPSTANDTKTQFTRHQQTVQPAFAITCHGAQGQTCPFVIADLTVGKFHAYVAASRPKSRYQLAITNKVSLGDLRKPLPPSLKKEGVRLDALAHNTLVTAGVLNERLKNVPGLPFVSPLANIRTMVFDDTSDNQESGSDDSNTRVTDNVGNELYRRFQCRWLSNYSCAYDTAVVSMTMLYLALPSRFRVDFRAISQHTSDLGIYAEKLQNERNSSNLLDHARDDLRLKLSQFDSRLFPATDAALVGIADIFNVVANRQSYPFKLRLVTHCVCCGALEPSLLDSYAGDQCLLPAVSPRRGFGRVHVTDTVQRRLYSTVAMEMNIVMPFNNTVYTAVKEAHSVACPGQLSFRFAFVKPPPFIYFEVDAASEVLCYASRSIVVSSDRIRYALCSIIYYSSAHFRCQLFSREHVYKYDGMQAEGVLRKQCNVEDIMIAETDCIRSDSSNGQIPSLFLYARID